MTLAKLIPAVIQIIVEGELDSPAASRIVAE